MNKKIETIQASGYKANIVITGGGTEAIGKIMTHAGASRFVNEIIVPYSTESMTKYLGKELKSGCSINAAIAIADRAFLSAPFENGLGVSCTAALRTTRERRGKDRAHICIIDKHGIKNIKVEFLATTREYQEFELSRAIIDAIYDFVNNRMAIANILNGTEKTAPILNGKPLNIDCIQDIIILSGSFNPLHEGHRNLLKVAEKITGKTGLYEISLTNVDKGKLKMTEIDLRLRQFAQENLIFTNAQLFVDKAKLFPGAWFVIGYDTAIRILDPKYNDVKKVVATFKELGTKFIVGGRHHEGKFYTFNKIASVLEHGDIFIEIPESEFREDISSTELRNK